MCKNVCERVSAWGCERMCEEWGAYVWGCVYLMVFIWVCEGVWELACMCVVCTWVHVRCVRMSVWGYVCVSLCECASIREQVCVPVSVYFVSAFSSKSGFLELERVLKLVQDNLPLDPTVQITTHLTWAQLPTACPFPLVIPWDPRHSPSEDSFIPFHRWGNWDPGGPEGDGSAAKSRELVFGQMSALATHFRISSNSSDYARNRMPIQSPCAFIILFLFSFDSITFFFYLISPLGSTPPRINETVTLTSLTPCSARCI